MELVTPALGTIFWMVIVFGVVMYILKRFAWRPILSALNDREESIRNDLKAAKNARLQINNLKAEQDQIRAEALHDKELIMKEAREIKDKILNEACENAAEETQKLMTRMREEMENEKRMAMTEIRRQIADYSVMIAGKILREKLEESHHQERIINDQLEDFKLN